jgi:hypothetical protein
LCVFNFEHFGLDRNRQLQEQARTVIEIFKSIKTAEANSNAVALVLSNVPYYEIDAVTKQNLCNIDIMQMPDDQKNFMKDMLLQTKKTEIMTPKGNKPLCKEQDVKQ